MAHSGQSQSSQENPSFTVSPTHRRFRLGTWLLVGGFAAVGCLQGAALEDPEQFLNGSFAGASSVGDGDGVEACNALPIFEERCAGGICHTAGDDGSAPGGGTDLTTEGVAARILSQPALTYGGVSDPENCPTTPELLINPVNPEASLLLTKLLGTHSCGDAMPVPNPPTSLDDADIECVRSWINGVIASSDGAAGTGGTAVGTGGAATGGVDAGTGGAATGGVDAGTGGVATGGVDAGTGGAGTGGMGTGGTGTVSMPGDCTSTPECQAKYAGATDCSNGMGGICLCGADPCVAP